MTFSLAAFLRRSWQTHRALTLLGLAMAALAVFTSAGILLDPRSITGAPAWVKPTKFALSVGIYSFTVAWLLSYLPERKVFARRTGNVIVAMFFVEMVIIVGQALRGKPSHFNAGSALDGALFSAMGIAIGVLYLASIATAFALSRARIGDRAFASAVRIGLVVSLVGMAQAGFMLAPTAEQSAAMAAGEALRHNGGHTVGAPDGGPGLPFLGWSTEHGDLRIGHFVGMHAIQVLPLFAWLLARRRRLAESQRLALVRIAGAAHLALVGLTTWQALRGQSVVAPDALTLAAFGAIVVAAATAAAWALRTPATARAPAPALR